MFGKLLPYFFHAENRIHVNSTITVDRTSPVQLRGRGVWESNPPGTAPSDPSAVLKTVRPTGAPTPPCLWMYFAIHILPCQAGHYPSSQRPDALHINLGQIPHHQ